MTTTCSKCGGTLQKGYATADVPRGEFIYNDARLQFLVSDVTTSANPIKAFKQGLSGDHPQHTFRIEGIRCSKCGFIELYGL